MFCAVGETRISLSQLPRESSSNLQEGLMNWKSLSKGMKQAWARVPYILDPRPSTWRNHPKLVDHANGARMVDGDSLWPRTPKP